MTETNDTGRGYQYSNAEILDAIRRVAPEDGVLTIDEYNSAGDVPSSSVVIDRFGSWVAAKEEAGIDGDGRVHNSRPREYSTSEMVEMLQECEQRHGSVTQSNFDADDDFCSSSAIVKRFGEWSQAKEEAGVA